MQYTVSKDEFGKKLSELRKRSGLTQAEIADSLHVTSAAVSKWMTGKCYPDISQLPMLAGLFNVSIGDLFEDTLAPLPDDYDGEYRCNIEDLLQKKNMTWEDLSDKSLVPLSSLKAINALREEAGPFEIKHISDALGCHEKDLFSGRKEEDEYTEPDVKVKLDNDPDYQKKYSRRAWFLVFAILFTFTICIVFILMHGGVAKLKEKLIDVCIWISILVMISIFSSIRDSSRRRKYCLMNTELIKSAMETAGLSVKELSKMTKIPQMQLKRVIDGKYILKDTEATHLADALNVKPSDLFI